MRKGRRSLPGKYNRGVSWLQGGVLLPFDFKLAVEGAKSGIRIRIKGPQPFQCAAIT